MNTPVSTLADLGACRDAREWVRANKHESLESAWLACERGDWMLWYAGIKSCTPESPERKRLVVATCECAREMLPIFERHYPNDKRVRECIETAEQWARGEDGVTIEMVREKCNAAYAAAYVADADAAYAAADVMRKRCAEIVRKHYPTLP